MGILFRYKNRLSSSEFNQRFADALGGSILNGFLLSKGTGLLDVSITSRSNESNLLITKTGVRIEEPNDLIDVITLTPNEFITERVDMIYAKYVHGTKEAVVEYSVTQGEEGGEPPLMEPEDTHTLLGVIVLPPLAEQITNGMISHPERGLHLKDVANPVAFKSPVAFNAEITVPSPTKGTSAINSDFLQETLRTDVNEQFPYGSVLSEVYNEGQRIFENVTYKRPDGSVYMTTQLTEPNPEGKFSKVVMTHFDVDGVSSLSTESWQLTYDEFGNITSKVRV